MKHPTYHKRNYLLNARRPFHFIKPSKKTIPLRIRFQKKNNDVGHHRIHNLTSTLSKQYESFLISSGFKTYLRKNIGGSMSEKVAKQTIRQESIYLAWFQENFPLTSENKDYYLCLDLPSKLFYIFMKHPISIAKFLSYLEDSKNSKPMTCYNYIISNTHTLNWLYVDYYDVLDSLGWTRSFNGEPYHALARRLRSMYRKSNKVRVQALGNIDQLIKEGRWPVGGLPELQHAVDTRLEWAQELASNLQASVIPLTRTDYIEYVRLLCSSFYTSAHQGRQLALSNMTYKDLRRLRKKQRIRSTKFKTAAVYGYQTISVMKSSLELLTMYIDVVRPKLLQLYNLEANPSSPGLLNFDGVSALDVGRRVTEFYSDHLGLHITTTAIRSIVETDMEDRYRNNDIDFNTRVAVMNLGGHSSATTRDHYIRRQRDEETELVNRAWRQPQPGMGCVSTPSRIEPDVGIAHEYHGVDRERIPWSKAEKVWLLQWRKLNQSSSASQCLAAIRETAASRQLFHKHHVEDAAKLAYGLAKIRSGKW